MTDQCECGSGFDYPGCCGRLIEQGEPAETAEQLMRSRYTAFVRMNRQYLLESWHPATRPSGIEFDIRQRWLGLKIRQTINGSASDRSGIVEFVARFKINGKASRLHETSYCERLHDRWHYHSGEFS